MSIASEINRISQNISDSLEAVALKGVTVPTGSTSDDLPELIAAIPTGSGDGFVITDEIDSHGGTVRTITAVEISGTKTITANGTGIDVTEYASVDVAVPSSAPVLQTVTKSYTPTESQQTETITPGTGYDGIGEVDVTVGAISSSYVGSGITRRSSSDLTASGATVNVPAGYYSSAASKAVASGTEGTPTATKGTVTNHQVTVTPSVTNVAGYISGGTKSGTGVTVTASELESGTKSITSNGTGIDVTGYASVDVAVPTGADYPIFTITLNGDQISSISCNKTFSECSDYITNNISIGVLCYQGVDDVAEGLQADMVSGTFIIYSLGSYNVPALRITYNSNGTITWEENPIDRRNSSDLTVSGDTVSVPAGYYASNASKAVSAGTAGTPSATKGTVSNHSVTVTPSVTNVAGYISGGTKTGTGVTVTASELESGTKSITENGTNIDVTGYASVNVNVPSSPSATQHSIYFEFSDNTNTTIPVYYNDSFVSTMITSSKPVTYGLKTVTLAELDGVMWYEPVVIPLNTELIDYSKVVSGYYVGDDGELHENEWSSVSDYTEVDPSMTFAYTCWYWYYIGVYDENKNLLRTIYCMNDATQDPNEGNIGHGTLSGNKLSNARYVRLCGPDSEYISLIRTA